MMMTNPEECFDQSPFGFGPFPVEGGVVVCVPHPPGGGYGGIGFGPHAYARGGTGYGLSSFGSRTFPSSPFPISGGYGGDPYGHSGYGGKELVPPQVSSAISLNGFEIEVFFSEEMDPNSPALLDPLSYILEPISGAAPSLVSSVSIETLGSVDVILGDSFAGVTSVIIRHTGTTLGGSYYVVVNGPQDVSGDAILNSRVSLLTKGEAPAFTVIPQSGTELLVQFDQDMLPIEDTAVGAVNTIESPGEYLFTSTPDFPIALTAQSVDHPYLGNLDSVFLGVQGQTSLQYNLKIGPALAVPYDGSILPDQSSDFIGQEFSVGVGGLSIIESTRLKMTANDGSGVYGWLFSDISGKLIPSATFRADLDFEAFFTKPIGIAPDTIILFQILDSAIEFNISLGWDGITTKPLVTVFTGPGGFSQTFDTFDWTTGQHSISLVRNYQAGIVTALFDGSPIFSTNLVNLMAPASPSSPSVSVTISSDGLVGGFPAFYVDQLQVTASTTIYSSAWNFLHEGNSTFVGDASFTQDSLKTKRGPLVKGWGDATPATKEDVQVFVNNVEVGVSNVNPYTGEVTLSVPVPLLPPGETDIKVDYKWFASPTLNMVALNRPGLVLNKYDTARNPKNPPRHGDQIQVLPGQNYLADPGFPKGGFRSQRFPYNVVLGLGQGKRRPKNIGHRYMGFETEYSAVLNSPTTLLLNQHPNRSQVPAFVYGTKGVSVAFEGVTNPSTTWDLQGTDTGGVNVGEGTYTLIDANSGSFNPEDPQAVVYSQDLDLSFPSSFFLGARFEISETEPHGVFTGVGFGFHNNEKLFLVGALSVNGLEHIGFLLNPDRPDLISSWEIGPETTLSIESYDTVKVVTSEIPTTVSVGDRFQVLSGTQQGTYTITEATHQMDGFSTLGVTPDFPANPNLYGNKFPSAIFETKWSNRLVNFRLEADPEQGVAILQISGERTATIAELDGTAPSLPSPSSTSLLLPVSDSDLTKGSVFWGSLSRQATNETIWSFFRYGVVPDVTSIRGHSITQESNFQVLPESPWFTLESFGQSAIDTTGDSLLLKSTSHHPNLPFIHGYARNEVFLVPEAFVDLTVIFRIESGIGNQDGTILIQNGNREIQVSNLTYLEISGRNEIVDMDTISFSGILDPIKQTGWQQTSGQSLSLVFQGQNFSISQDAESKGGWIGTLGTPESWDTGGRILELQFAVTDHTANGNGDTGIEFTGEVGNLRAIRTSLRSGGTPGIRVLTGNTLIQEYDFDWTDGELHIYRWVANEETGVLAIYIDDSLIGSLDLTLFSGGSGNVAMSFGSFGTNLSGVVDSSLTSTTQWRSGSFQILPPNTVSRTLGVFVGSTGEEKDINQWKVPRTDGLSVLNSSAQAQIEEWDWRSDIELRLLLDPLWGVTILRPDLPLPPTYIGETETGVATGFHTRKIEPSAGWINVEYGNLPKFPVRFGSVQFGALNGKSVTQQRWHDLKYRIFRHYKDDLIQPQNMVLNRYNVITSGELLEDKTLENVALVTLDSKRISLRPTHITASRIFKVIDEGKPVGEQIFTFEMFDFDVLSQTITLIADSAGNPRSFSGDHVLVTAIFAPGKPVTETYLKIQPLLDSITLLNEGTPPYPKSQVGKTMKKIAVDGQLEDIDATEVADPDNILSDPDRFLDHEIPPEILYEKLSFFEVSQGETGLIQFPCEATELDGLSGCSDEEGEDIYEVGGAGTPFGGTGDSANLTTSGSKVCSPYGGHVLQFSGTQFFEHAKKPPVIPFEQKGGMPGGFLFASGGSFVGPTVDGLGNPTGIQALGGTIGPGSAVLYPTAPAGRRIRRGVGHGRVYQRTDWYLRLNSVIPDANSPEVSQDLVETLPSFSDTIPPTLPGLWNPNPGGIPDADGAAFAVLETAGDYSRYGPWGGLSSLTPTPDSGLIVFGSTIQDGATVSFWTSTVGPLITFTAKTVPVASTDFAISPQPHIDLANLINTTAPLNASIRAFPGLTLSGEFSVRVEGLSVASTTNILAMTTSDASSMAIHRTIPFDTGSQIIRLLTGGAKILQGSLLGGGVSTLNEIGIHDSLLGIMVEGGFPLPQGQVQFLTLSN